MDADPGVCAGTARRPDMTGLALDPAPVPLRPRSGSTLRSLGILLAAQLAGGVLIGLIWLAWSPSTVSYVLAGGDGRTFQIPDETEARIAGDGRFVLLSVAAGLIFAAIYWSRRRLRGPAGLLVLAVGSVLSSLLARTVGQALAHGASSGPVNTAIKPPLALHSAAALWVQALLAVLVYTVLVGTTSDSMLGADGPPEPPPQAGPLSPSDLPPG
jgi:hypothetical protein